MNEAHVHHWIKYTDSVSGKRESFCTTCGEEDSEGRLEAVHTALVWADNVHMDGVSMRKLLFEVVQTGRIPAGFSFDAGSHEQRVDELAKRIWEASHRDEGSISATGAQIVARDIIDHVPSAEYYEARLVAAEAERDRRGHDLRALHQRLADIHAAITEYYELRSGPITLTAETLLHRFLALSEEPKGPTNA